MTVAVTPPFWYSWAGITIALALSVACLALTLHRDPARATRWIPAALHLAWVLLLWVPNTMRLVGFIAPATYSSYVTWMAGPVFAAGPWGMWPVILLIGLDGRLQVKRAIEDQVTPQ